jgi:diguanylate cyclase (GGDEF)-like protein
VGFEPVGGLPPDLRVRSILAEDDELWVGSETGLYRFQNDQWRFYSVDDGLPNDFVLTIHRATDDAVWFGTAGGLGTFTDGEFKTADPQSGFPDLAVYQILEDQRQGLWLCTAQGIWRIDREDQQRLQNGTGGQLRPLRIAESEGMASRECNGGTQPAGAGLPDGRLAFPTVEGLVVVDPERLRQAAPSPAAVIERLVVDGRELSAFGETEIAPGRRSLTLQYTAPSFLSPADVRFRYLLEGFHEEWVESGNRRDAFFTNLDSGTYNFRVAAALQDGAWGDEAVVPLVVRPFVHERIWFWPLPVGVAALGLFGSYRNRVAGLKRRQAELESVVRERTRDLRAANEQLEELVSIDGLTQLANYRSFQEEMHAEFGRAQRRQRPLSLVLFDIDYFKDYNDTFGHAEGDRCLQEVAAALASTARRGGEVVARYGGEEFAVLLPEVEEADAVELAETVRASIEALEVANPASDVSRFVTMSGVVASIVPSRNQTTSVLFELADNALYDAKHGGRNRITVRRDTED